MFLISFVFFGKNPGQSVTKEIWPAIVIFVKIRALKTKLLCVKECQFVLFMFIARFAKKKKKKPQRSAQNVAENS